MHIVSLHICKDFIDGKGVDLQKAPQVFSELHEFDHASGDGPNRYTATLLKALPPKDKSLQAFPKP